MDAKLTLKLDNDVIQRSKKYAAEKKTSLSRMVENYLNSISRQDEEFEVSPFVKSISTGKSIPENIEREDYIKYLEEKYK